MSQPDVHLPQRRAGVGLFKTARGDAWYVQPGLVFLGLMTFVVYSTWAALVGVNYHYAGQGADYLSPFYSPLIWGASEHAMMQRSAPPGWWPSLVVTFLLTTRQKRPSSFLSSARSRSTVSE